MATEWNVIDNALANMGEDDERVLGCMVTSSSGNVCWWSCGNIKMAEITGISGFTMASPEMVQAAAMFLGDNSDYEVAIPVLVGDKAVMIAIDCCDCVEVIGECDGEIDATCDEYEASDCASLPDEVVDLYDLIDGM